MRWHERLHATRMLQKARRYACKGEVVVFAWVKQKTYERGKEEEMSGNCVIIDRVIFYEAQ